VTYVPPRIRNLHAGGARIRSTVRLVVERDGSRCRRCGIPIDMTLGGLDPDGPTLGHVTPVAQGGTDGLGNLALEHRRCNLAAGSRADPPRALIANPIPIE
jgi:5-methylcytosine-specific restriction endonuclease McrA